MAKGAFFFSMYCKLDRGYHGIRPRSASLSSKRLPPKCLTLRPTASHGTVTPAIMHL